MQGTSYCASLWRTESPLAGLQERLGIILPLPLDYVRILCFGLK